MIFLTGAAGKTGRAILKSLQKRHAQVQPLVRSNAQAEEIRTIGNFQTLLGDLRDIPSFESQLQPTDVFYYICPNISPDELEIGKNLISLAKRMRISRFVYHSVLHPQIEAMPHHWQKMRMEEALFESGLDFTILQPCAYMQNILGGWNAIKSGKYITPYKVTSRISMVDLEDVAEVAAKVLTQSGHSNAIYELAGPEALSQSEVSQHLSQVLGYPVQSIEQSQDDWQQIARKYSMVESQIATLLKMFTYYDKNGLAGNSTLLGFLLGRKPTTFRQFLTHTVDTGDGI